MLKKMEHLQLFKNSFCHVSYKNKYKNCARIVIILTWHLFQFSLHPFEIILAALCVLHNEGFGSW